jgi:hypothetical protein
MKNADAIALLRAELADDLELIRANVDKNREMTQRVDRSSSADEFEYAALGYTLHNLYTAFEAYFLRVAKFFENELDQSGWHKSLVERMTLTVPGVRPALLDREMARRLYELLQFRHVFRNLYKSRLVPEKVRWANSAAEGIAAAFEPQHARFDAFLADLAERLDSEVE